MGCANTLLHFISITNSWDGCRLSFFDNYFSLLVIEKIPVRTLLPERYRHGPRDGDVGNFLYLAWHIASLQPHQPHIRGEESILVFRAEMYEAIQCVVVEIFLFLG